jgi:anoctamin-10
MRADSIGSGLESFSFLTWLAILTTFALVYLFRDAHAHIGSHDRDTQQQQRHHHPRWRRPFVRDDERPGVQSGGHGFLVAHAVIRHLLEKIVWEGSEEAEEAERDTREVNEQ